MATSRDVLTRDRHTHASHTGKTQIVICERNLFNFLHLFPLMIRNQRFSEVEERSFKHDINEVSDKYREDASMDESLGK